MEKKTKALTRKQKTAIKLMITKSYEETAKSLGVTVETLYRWLEDAEFMKGLNKEIESVTREADSIMKLSAKAAVWSICELSQKASSESVRLAASKEIITYVKAAEGLRSGENGQILRLIEGLRQNDGTKQGPESERGE